MRKLALLAAGVGVFLALPSFAAAAIPQGALIGVGTINNAFQFNATVLDGGTSYIGLGNDKSGNCDGDSGSVLVQGVLSFNIVCAHFVASSRGSNAGSPKMRFAYQASSNPDQWNVVRITDNGVADPCPCPDTFASGTVLSLAAAIAWVNTGAVGSANGVNWSFLPLSAGDYQVHP